MGKKQSFDRHNDRGRKLADNSFSTLVDCLNMDATQRKEFLQREQEQKASRLPEQTSREQENPHKSNPKTFEEQLYLTNFWLEETFPKLFAADDYLPLGVSVLGDLKREYKKKRFKRGYPKGLVIEAALSRYKKSFGYLESLQEGVSLYNLDGEPSGIVTREEHKAAQKILNTL